MHNHLVRGSVDGFDVDVDVAGVCVDVCNWRMDAIVT